MNLDKFPLLGRYRGVEDLKKMSLDTLEALAQEVREFLIVSLDRTGGHLSSNLGVVELTIALLYCFDFSYDAIIFDVGHQSYCYKLLTDRKDSFASLRKQGGLSGFPKREESSYDFFNTGHASTSLSAILGLARSSFLLNKSLRSESKKVNFSKKTDRNFIALIGDGAMTGGMTFEAINNMKEDDNVLIILNDNQMSIAPNVGGLHRHLEQLRISTSYLKIKPKLKQTINDLPFIGRHLKNFLARQKQKLRRSLGFYAGYFDYLGLRYYGPIQGHDLPSLIHYFNSVKKIKGPRILHVCTQKGRGYLPAEQKPDNYHGVGAYFYSKEKLKSDCKNSEIKEEKTAISEIKEKKQEVVRESEHEKKLNYKSYTDAFTATLLKIADQDDKVVAITAAMPDGTGLTPFAKRYPSRFFDVGIAEAHAVTFAAGLSIGGLKPLVAIYSTFLQRAYDQVLHDVCLQNLPLIFVLDRAGIVGADGETHQGLFDISYLSSMPNMSIYSPFSYSGVNDILPKLLCNLTSPVALRLPRGASDFDLRESEQFSFFTKKFFQESYIHYWQLKKYKSKILLICEGNRGEQALTLASSFLKKSEEKSNTSSGTFLTLDVCILERLKPFDYELLAKLSTKYEAILTWEEGMLRGGFGEHLISEFAKRGIYKKYKNLGIDDVPVHQASYIESLEKHGLDEKTLLKEITLWFEAESKMKYEGKYE